jgi:hypothetical protein
MLYIRQAQWTRDFAMAVMNAPTVMQALPPPANVAAAVRYSLAGISSNGWAPDRVDATGRAIYAPGSGDWSAQLAWDNHAYIALLVTAYADGWQDSEFFCENEPRVRRVLDILPRSPSGLVFNDPQAPNVSFGFEDSVVLPGQMLTVSLLLYDAAQRMATWSLRTGCGDTQHYRAVAEGVVSGIDKLYDPHTGLFLASDLLEAMPDIWGSVYLVYLNLSTPVRRQRVAEWLATEWRRDSAIFSEGQLRHLPPPLTWRRCWQKCPPVGTYQNGAYWATPLQWALPVLQAYAPDVAREMAMAVLSSFVTSGVLEAFNRPINYTGVQQYVASAVNVLGALVPDRSRDHDPTTGTAKSSSSTSPEPV